MYHPKEITMALAKPPENVLQAAYLVSDDRKTALLKQLIRGKDLPSILIFSSTKSGVKELEKELINMKFNAKAIHSDLEQNERKEVLRLFRNREIQILVATDIVSRGIDIENISLVINYNVPQDAEDYVHRVGRTARAEKTGVALTFVNHRETMNFKRIEKLIGNEIKKLPLPDELSKSSPGKESDRNPERRKSRSSRKWSGNSNRGNKGSS